MLKAPVTGIVSAIPGQQPRSSTVTMVHSCPADNLTAAARLTITP
ncbi:hypothetical protein [Anaerobiospirillum sp. NML120449]|nr:hypothetical protein [Anaerobiospirillum sp. NML120449]